MTATSSDPVVVDFAPAGGRPLTAKGERSAARILEAATTVLARDGVGGATLGGIAEEAGVDKRNVLYYYGSREAVLVQVVQTVGGQIAQHVGAAAEPAADPEALADAAVESLWTGVTSVPAVARAYFALVGGGAGTPVVEAALQDLKRAYLAAITQRLQAAHGTGWRLRGDERSTAVFVLILLRGLLLEWTETGDCPAITAAVERFKEALAREFVPA